MVRLARYSLIVAIIGSVLRYSYATVSRARHAAHRTHCKKHLKIIGLAIHNYSDVYGSLPPAYVTDENGRRMHSWRVLIIPFLDCLDLYREYRFDEPWDRPNNSKLAGRMPYLFRCPASDDYPGMCNFRCVTGRGTAFPGARAVVWSEITDGSSNTLLVTEVNQGGVHWMEPEDVPVEQAYEVLQRQDYAHTAGIHMLLGDGTVQFLRNDVDPTTLDHLLMIADGNLLGEF